MKAVILKTADEELGKTNVVKKVDENNLRVEDLSKRRKALKEKIDKTKEAEENRKLRQERNLMSKKIKKVLRKEYEQRIDQLVADIERTKDDARMFSAVKALKTSKDENRFLYDADKRKITNKKEIHDIIKTHFSTKFYNENVESVEPVFDSKPLKNPITKEEVRKAVKKMNNGKAGGYDHISVELIKYGDIDDLISIILNNVIQQTDEIDMGRSLLKVLQKPKKEKGPVTNLRPINLLPIIRKILSSITLNRIKGKVDKYLSSSQSAYREGRSTSDVVWAHRWLCAKAQTFQGIKIYNTGIDMSSAFDTILRKELVQELETFLAEDEMRMIRVLLSDTKMIVKDQFMCDEFKTNLGSPQGDSISGIFFNVYFEKHLRKVREMLDENKTLAEHRSLLPAEMIYADDCDFITERATTRDIITTEVSDILKEGNLIVNHSKTENIVIERKDKESETWRNTTKLGSLLGDQEDIQKRKTLAMTAMNKMKKIWIRKNKVGIRKRLKLYNTLVKPVLTYNASTWGMTKTEAESMDAFHRQQLRRIWNFSWKDKVRNEDLYRISAGRPITQDIVAARWRLFGHCLRLKSDAPAQKSMDYFFDNYEQRKKFRGRPRETLLKTLEKDIMNQKDPVLMPVKKLKDSIDLSTLRLYRQ